MPKAKLIIKEKVEFQDGGIVEIKVWEVPKTKDKPHGYKYSFVYIRHGKRVIGYDNSEGKGDHRHYGNKEERYKFTGRDKLLEDFYDDIRRARENEN
ncbi:MAG: DUF6516 family protein [Deltaproteobacteria bacterium]